MLDRSARLTHGAQWKHALVTLLNPQTGQPQAGGYTTNLQGQSTVTYRSSQGIPGTCRIVAWEALTGQSSSASVAQFQYSVAVAAGPSSIPADGASTSTVTVTVTNPNTGAPISGDSVTLALSGTACGTVSPAGPYTTNANGQVAVTYTAAATPGSCTATAREGTTLNTGSTAITQFQYAVSVTANPSSIPADGTSTSMVTVTVTNPNTGAPISGDPVTLALSGAGCGTVSPAGPYTTNTSGQVVVTYTSTVAGTCIITATETKTRKSASAAITATTQSTSTSTTITTTTTTTTSTTATTTTTLCNCCGQLPSLLSFTTASSGCGTNPPGEVTPPRCVQGTNNGTSCRRCSCGTSSDCGTGGVCTGGRCSAGDANHIACVTNSTCSVGQTCTDSDADCTGGGVCRGHLDCTGLYFGGGQPSGINLPATIPDLGLSFSKVASCTGGNPNLTSSLDTDVPGPGCSTPAGTPTYGQRHCTSPGCIFGAPLAIPNPASTATGTCVVNVIANRTGVGTGSAVCSTGAVSSLTLPLDSQIYLTGAIEPVRVCSTCVGGTPGVCGSGTCGGGPRNGLACTPETNALNGSYPTSHDCPPPNAPNGQIVTSCGLPNGSFIGCLPVDFGLSTATQTKTAFATAAQARVLCGFCFDPNLTLAFANPPDPCTSDAHCAARGDDFTSCQQHSNGAFRNAFATTITETGTPPNVCIADGANHPATLVSLFCVPPSYNGIVDPSGELPGPGAVSLPGTSKFIP